MRPDSRPSIERKVAGLRAQLIRGAGMALVILASGAALTYLWNLLFARWMGASSYGSFAYALSWAMVLSVVAGLGLPTGTLRFVPHYLLKRDWNRLRGIMRRSTQVTFATGVLIAIIASIFLPYLQHETLGTNAVIIGAWLVPLLALVSLQSETIRATQSITQAYFPHKLVQPSLAIALGGLILFKTGNLNSEYALGALAISLVVTIFLQRIMLRLVLPRESYLAPCTFETAKWLRLSFPLLLITGFQITQNHADVIMIGMFLEPGDVGVYNAALATARIVSFLLMAGNAITAPMIASLYAAKDLVSLQRIVTAVTRWTFWSSLTVAVAVVVLSTPILGLFGPEFGRGRASLMILAFGQLVLASTGPVGYLLALTAHEKKSAAVHAWSVTANVGLNAALIPLWGIQGAAVATAGSMILQNLWLHVLVQRHLGIRCFALIPAVVREGSPSDRA